MRIQYLITVALLLGLVNVLPGGASIGDSPTIIGVVQQFSLLDASQITGGNDKNSIIVHWEPHCLGVHVEATGAPIHSVVINFADGTRDYTNRFAKDPLGYIFQYESVWMKPIESIHVKIQNEKYKGPGLGPKFKCGDEYDPSDYF